MKNKIIFVLLILFSLSLQSYSQQNCHLSGLVVSNGQGIPNVTVTLLNSDSVLQAGTITSDSGKFILNFKTDSLKFILVVKALNYVTIKRNLDFNTLPISGLTISLEQTKSINLAEVQVTARKQVFERRPDMLIFNVENSLTAIGGTALDAISKAPGVYKTDNSISIQGNNQVSIMVNDRLIKLSGSELINYLNSIPSYNIKRIEIITNPSAKYDAEGLGGILNIVLKKPANQGLLINSRATYEQRKNPAYGENINFNYQANKLSLYGFVNSLRAISNPIEVTQITYPNSFWSTSNNRYIKRNINNFQFGADYQINKKLVIGFLAEGNIYFTSSENAHSTTEIFNSSRSNIDSSLSVQNRINTKTIFNTYNINLKNNIDDKGSFFSIDLDYLRSHNLLNQNFGSVTALPDNSFVNPVSNLNFSPQLADIYDAKFDARNFLKNYIIEWGGKVSFSKIDNDYTVNDVISGVAVIDTSRTNHFLYQENIQSIYGSIDRKWKKVEIKLGLRGEYTEITANSITLDEISRQNYLKLFPTGYILYNIDENNKVNLNYGIRIQRPGFSDLNPFKYYINTYTFSEGNPQLRPAYTNSFSANYSFQDKYFLSLYARITNGYFQQVPLINDANNSLFYTRENVGKVVQTGISLTIPVQITKWYNLDWEPILYETKQNDGFQNNNIAYNQLSFYNYVNNQFTISKKQSIFAELDYIYSSKTRSFVYVNDPYSSVDFTIRKSLFNKLGSISFSIFDIFHTSPNASIYQTTGQLLYFKNNYESRYTRVTFSYKFGNQKTQGKRNRESGNSSERSRL